VRKRKELEIIPRPELVTLSDRTFVLIMILIEALLVYWSFASKT
jgi:hypothetical protein